MVLSIVFWAIVVVIAFIFGIFVGQCNLWGFMFKNAKDDEAKKVCNENQDRAFVRCAYLLLFLVCMVGATIGAYDSVKAEAINKYRNGKIVENVNYHYQTINGEKVLKDSTITYTKYKE